MVTFKKLEKPTWWVSLLPFLFLVAALSVVIYIFGSDALSGASQVVLLFAAGFTVFLAMTLYRTPWKVLEDAMLDNITSVGTSIVILLLIGAVSGSYHRTFKLPVTISRCSNNYGPYHFPEKLIPLMIQKALRDEPLPVYGNGENVRVHKASENGEQQC